MFNRKQLKLNKASANGFVKKSMVEASVTTSLGNGAKKYTTTGDPFVDQFGKASNYRKPRTFAEVSKDMETLWNTNPRLAVCMVFYLRMITRVVQFFTGEKTETSQKGQGLKNEGMMRMLWIAMHHPDTFYKNISLYISVASWKDIFQMLQLDLEYHTWKDKKLDWSKFGKLLVAGLNNPNTSELVKKYMPQIKSKGAINTTAALAKTMTAKWLCSVIFGGKQDDYRNYKNYRQLKSSGTAHSWQKLISQRAFEDINFDTIHGRALAQLANGKFLNNHNLTARYNKWIESKPTAKYTGYVYELFQPLGTRSRMSTRALQKHQISTINKQFLELVDKAQGQAGTSRLIGVLDSSASMFALAHGTKVSAYSVGKSMCLFLSYMLKDTPFANHFLEFSNETTMKQWKGNTPIEQMVNETSSEVAGTNFQSVPKHFVKMLKAGVPESEFPTGIVCFSDGCFNQSGKKNNKTNFVKLKQRLLKGGFSKKYVDNFLVILWDIPNSWYSSKGQTSFEGSADTPSLIHVSGLDPSAIALVTGAKSVDDIPKTSEEMMNAALSQEVMQMIEV